VGGVRSGGVSAYLYLSWGTVGLQVIKQLIRYLKNTALKKNEVEINGTHELNTNLQLSVYNISTIISNQKKYLQKLGPFVYPIVK